MKQKGYAHQFYMYGVYICSVKRDGETQRRETVIVVRWTDADRVTRLSADVRTGRWRFVSFPDQVFDGQMCVTFSYKEYHSSCP